MKQLLTTFVGLGVTTVALAGPPKIFFEGCIQIQPGPQGCLSGATEDAAFFLDSVNSPVPLGEFFLGDQIHVEGSVIQGSSICFPIIGPKLTVTAARPCVAGDANYDGAVDFADVVDVLSAWGPCAPESYCKPDLDRDGSVSFSDLLGVLSGFGG